MFDDLKAKKILVVGGSNGIGRQLAITLNSIGVEVLLVGRNEKALNELGEKLKCPYYVCDINENDQVQTLASSVQSLSGVCISSGIVKLSPPKLLSNKSIDLQITTNLSSPLNLIGALLKNNAILDKGAIVLTAASGRICQPPCSAAYAASKLGLVGAAKSLSADLLPKKIRVNVVSFDYVKTDMIEGIKTTDLDIIGISPVEYSSFPYLFALSEMSRWTTGQTIAADAGRMLSKIRYV